MWEIHSLIRGDHKNTNNNNYNDVREEKDNEFGVLSAVSLTIYCVLSAVTLTIHCVLSAFTLTIYCVLSAFTLPIYCVLSVVTCIIC